MRLRTIPLIFSYWQFILCMLISVKRFSASIGKLTWFFFSLLRGWITLTFYQQTDLGFQTTSHLVVVGFNLLKFRFWPTFVGFTSIKVWVFWTLVMLLWSASLFWCWCSSCSGPPEVSFCEDKLLPRSPAEDILMGGRGSCHWVWSPLGRAWGHPSFV